MAIGIPASPGEFGSLPKNRDRVGAVAPACGHEGPFAFPGQTQHVARAQRPAGTGKPEVQHHNPRPAEDRGRAFQRAAGGQFQPLPHKLRAGVNGYVHFIAPALLLPQLDPGHAQVVRGRRAIVGQRQSEQHEGRQPWSAATCRRFRFAGRWTPVESGDKSPHSKGAGISQSWRACMGGPINRITFRTREGGRYIAGGSPRCHA